jgi:hypothetical protein
MGSTNQRLMATKRSRFFVTLWASLLCISGPCFFIFVVEQNRRSDFTLELATKGLLVCILAGLTVAVIAWGLILEPFAKRHGLE